MKAKIIFHFVLCVMVFQVSAQTNRVWNFKGGTNFQGDYVSSGTTAFVVRNNDSNYIFKLADLSTNDLIYINEKKSASRKAQRQAQLDLEATQMRQAGLMEFTTDLIKNFPEKVNFKEGWMDSEFFELDSIAAGYSDAGSLADVRLGFDAYDKNNVLATFCYMPKFKEDEQTPNPYIEVIKNLKQGDKVRLIGKIVNEDFRVEKAELIETAAQN
jgi:hypothetical protein